MEKSIPYISLNSYTQRDRKRVCVCVLAVHSVGITVLSDWCAASSPHPWRSQPASSGSIHCSTNSFHYGQKYTGCGPSSETQFKTVRTRSGLNWTVEHVFHKVKKVISQKKKKHSKLKYILPWLSRVRFTTYNKIKKNTGVDVTVYVHFLFPAVLRTQRQRCPHLCQYKISQAPTLFLLNSST